MLTQSAPAIVNALSGILPDAAVRALTQALGNCNQPLTHRAPLNLQPRNPQQNGPGTFGVDTWQPQDYYDIMPTASDSFSADIPGWGGPGGANSNNWYGDTFNFPTSQEFNLNNFFGGPNIFNAGNSFFDNQYTYNHTTENQYTTNLNVTYINGRPVAGPPGRPGDRGASGRAGSDGLDGLDGRDAILPAPKQQKIITGVTAKKASFAVVVDVRFNSDTCQVEVDKVDLPDVVTSIKEVPGQITYYGR